MTKRKGETVDLLPSPIPHKRSKDPFYLLKMDIANLEYTANMLSQELNKLENSHEQDSHEEEEEEEERLHRSNMEQKMENASQAASAQWIADFKLEHKAYIEDLSIKLRESIESEQKSKIDATTDEMKRGAQQAVEKQKKELRDEFMSILAENQTNAQEAQQIRKELDNLQKKNQQIRNEHHDLREKYETAVNRVSQQARDSQQDRQALQKLQGDYQYLLTEQHDLRSKIDTMGQQIQQMNPNEQMRLQNEHQQIRNHLETLSNRFDGAANPVHQHANKAIFELQTEIENLKTNNIMLHNKQTTLENKCQLLEEKNSRLEKSHNDRDRLHITPALAAKIRRNNQLHRSLLGSLLNEEQLPLTDNMQLDVAASYPSPVSETTQQQFGSSTSSIATTTHSTEEIMAEDIVDTSPIKIELDETMEYAVDGHTSGNVESAGQMPATPIQHNTTNNNGVSMHTDSTNNLTGATGYPASKSGTFGQTSETYSNGSRLTTQHSTWPSNPPINHVNTPPQHLVIDRQAPMASVAPTELQSPFSTAAQAAPMAAAVALVGTTVPHPSPFSSSLSAGPPAVSTTPLSGPGPKPQKRTLDPPKGPAAWSNAYRHSEKPLFGDKEATASEIATWEEFAASCRENRDEPRGRMRSASPDRDDRSRRVRWRSPTPGIRGRRAQDPSPPASVSRPKAPIDDTTPAGYLGVMTEYELSKALDEIINEPRGPAAEPVDSSDDESNEELDRALDEIRNEPRRNQPRKNAATLAKSSGGTSINKLNLNPQALGENLEEEPHTASRPGDIHDPYADDRATNNEARKSRHSDGGPRQSNVSQFVPEEAKDRRAHTLNDRSRTNRRSNDPSRQSNVLLSDGDRRAWSTNNGSRTGHRNNHNSNGGFHQSNMMSPIDEEEEEEEGGAVHTTESQDERGRQPVNDLPVKSIETDYDAIPVSENKRGKMPMQNGYAYDAQPANAHKPLGKMPLDKSQAYASLARPANDDDDDEADDEAADVDDEDEDDEDEDDDESDNAGAHDEGVSKYGPPSVTRSVISADLILLTQPHEAYNPRLEAEDDYDYEDGPELLRT